MTTAQIAPPKLGGVLIPPLPVAPLPENWLDTYDPLIAKASRRFNNPSWDVLLQLEDVLQEARSCVLEAVLMGRQPCYTEIFNHLADYNRRTEAHKAKVDPPWLKEGEKASWGRKRGTYRRPRKVRISYMEGYVPAS